ncbi:MAG TPA: enolase C-terminal domain-like protein [Thermomicrobiales bacterium]|nr:enolase C-terminal domain-like protein [Thermomicrobiales bacterium]
MGPLTLTGVDLFPVQLECTHPGGPARPDLRRHLLLRLTADGRLTGWGEVTGRGARPLTAPSVADLRDLLRDLLVGRDALAIALLHRELAAALASAARARALLCGVDLALHDLVGRALGVPAHQLHGGALRARIPVAYPIPAHRRVEDVADSIAYMGRMLERGFARVRFYVGLNLEADLLALRQMREAHGDRVRIKTLDCNGHLDWKAARAAIRRFRAEGHEFQLVESPARRGDHAGLAEVRRTLDVPVSEHAFTPEEALALVERRAVDVVNVTAVGAGGFGPARAIAAVAAAAGVACLLGAAHETSLGTAGQAHLGASLPELPYRCDCIGPAIYAEDVATAPLRYEGGDLVIPDGPGLGLTIDEDRLAALTEPVIARRQG